MLLWQENSAVAPVCLQGSSVCNKTQQDTAGHSGALNHHSWGRSGSNMFSMHAEIPVQYYSCVLLLKMYFKCYIKVFSNIMHHNCELFISHNNNNTIEGCQYQTPNAKCQKKSNVFTKNLLSSLADLWETNTNKMCKSLRE